MWVENFYYIGLWNESDARIIWSSIVVIVNKFVVIVYDFDDGNAELQNRKPMMDHKNH